MPAQRYGIKRPRSLATAVYACRPIGRGVSSTRRRGVEGRVRASRKVKVLVWQTARWVGLVVYESLEGVFYLRAGFERVGELAET